ncbi:MAG: hypothetical protein C0399_06700 [Syntrophus sp. (in: bacteria)]|nr:hypothetical protein [Syntrophus sp. (in: bacteria)]
MRYSGGIFMETDNEKQTKKVKVLGQLTAPGHVDSIQKLIGFVSDLARKQEYGAERIIEIERAFAEVFTNIVTYAFREVSGDIAIACTLDRADRMVFKIIDWGSSFNMLLAGDPLFKDEFVEQGIPQPSARLVKKLTDTVEYQRLENMNYLFLTFSSVVRGG